MNKIITVIIGLTLFGSAFAQLKIVGTSKPAFNARRHDISVPNDRPPHATKLLRSQLSRLPQKTLATPETIRVCVLRVQFALDSTSLSTGDGHFILATDSSTVFEKAPHDKNFFNTQLSALARYYNFISHGKIVIEWEIFPHDDTLAYTLPDAMGYYGSDGWFGDNPASRLGGFFTDAIRFVDATGDVNWCNFDVPLVFHAGSDWQNDIGTLYPDYALLYPDIFVPSPHDLPTAFLVMPEFIVSCVDRGIVMPEYSSQDGQITLLNGVLAHEFGHFLGLVDLYSTGDFYPAVGYLSLMDSGHNIALQLQDEQTDEVYTVSGALPVYPSAWERAYLGWENFCELNSTGEYSLRACELPTDTLANTIYKINIDELEYFIIENRADVFWGNTTSVALKQDSTTGIILGILVADTFASAYDFLLPGSGMLIWRVNERVAYGDWDGDGINNFSQNQLQLDWQNPFIEAMEADGIKQLGVVFSYLGEDKDFYKWPQNTHFGPTTEPSSASKNGARTGIDISRISRRDTVMTFTFGHDGSYRAWTSNIGFALKNPLTVFDLDDDGADEIITSSYGLLFAWRGDGSKFVANNSYVAMPIYDGDTLLYPLPLAFLSENILSPISIADITGDGNVDLVFGDDAGNIWALHTDSTETTTAGNARFATVAGFPMNLGGAIDKPPLLFDLNGDGVSEIFVGTELGNFYALSGTDFLWSTNLRGEYAGAFVLSNNTIGILAQQARGKFFVYDFAGTQKLALDLPAGDLRFPAVAISDDDTIVYATCGTELSASDISIHTAITAGKISAWGDATGALLAFNLRGDMLAGFPVELNARPSAPVIFDGRVCFTAETLLYCYHKNGALVENFPLRLPFDTLSAEPCIDANGEIFIASSAAKLYAYGKSGDALNDYPIATGVSIASPAFGDFNGDGVYELAVGSLEGILACWGGFNITESPAWAQFGYGANFNRVISTTEGFVQCVDDDIAGFYNYPNPAKSLTYFRFSTAHEGEYTLKIFDEANSLVTKFSGTVTSNFPNEVAWDLTGIATGLYIAVLEVNIAGTKSINRHVVAVVR